MKEHTHAQNMRTEENAILPHSPVANSLQGAFLTLMPEIQKALSAEGYTTPTPIQEQSIPHLLEGRDLLGSAQTGTGKTAAFALPILHRLSGSTSRLKPGTPKALILAPTRELAMQIRDSIQSYGRFLRLRCAVNVGGVNQGPQVQALKRGVDILVATPGRLCDLMRQGYLRLNEVEIFVLDEVDRMLDMGFIDDIKEVLSFVPEKRQTLFLSATMTPKMRALAETMVTNPVRVNIAPDKPAVEKITQKVLFVDGKNKDVLLVSLLQNAQIKKVLIFTQMKSTADQVVDKLTAMGIRGTAIHGNKSQVARMKALDGFKRHHFRVLVATDVAARGIDIDDITHVINYDLPIEAETYVHRIGRTARAGASGFSISFCCAQERAYLRNIERLLDKSVPVEMDHAYHCEEASRSRLAAPPLYRRQDQRNRRPQGGPSQGRPTRYQGGPPQGHQGHPSRNWGASPAESGGAQGRPVRNQGGHFQGHQDRPVRNQSGPPQGRPARNPGGSPQGRPVRNQGGRPPSRGNR
ncbi:MAG: DEAD/DEAH box helicase [Nitrospirota bacterium]